MVKHELTQDIKAYIEKRASKQFGGTWIADVENETLSSGNITKQISFEGERTFNNMRFKDGN